MRKMKILGLIVLFGLFISTLMISWEVPAMAAEGKIVIGMVDAISGPFKASGDRFQLGAKYAVDEINAKGGLLGKQVALVVEDSSFKPDVAVRKTTKLILEDKADILIGCLGSHVFLAMMKAAEKYKVIAVNPNSEAASITGSEFNPYVFRTTPTTGQRTAATISYFAKYSKFKKFYILCQDASLGREAGEGFKQNLKKIPGSQLVGEDYHPVALKDFAPYISKVIASGAEVILTTNFGPDLGNLIKTEGQLGCKAVTGGGYLFDPVIMQDVREAGLGHLVIHHSLIDLDNPIQKKFVKDFQEKNKDLDKVLYSPVFGVNDYYYGMQWMFDAIKRAGSTDSAKLIQAWEGASYDMPWGKVTMRACDHQILTPYKAALIVKDNEFFSFPYTGKPVIIPEEEITVPLSQTGNARCK
ncbi:MAG TPA: ABC transporter substrate-binding protein [Thermodesulfobacteriota bacterium]|nr:ABC transporter substrate-binding protein [Thermodesulfobacteriota bacterium]